ITDRDVARDKADFPYPHYLSDGGLFDNLGSRAMTRALAEYAKADSIVISDAGGYFDAKLDNSFATLTGRTLRMTDIFMRRVGDLEHEHVKGRVPAEHL